MSNDTRELGIEFGALRTTFQDSARAFPLDQETLLEHHGDIELELGSETVRLETLLEPVNEDEYESYAELEATALGMVGEEAIGRKEYSDRTPPAVDEERPSEAF
ncbi:hypothetical protein ACLI4R_06590 [Natrialbaceae archaeon A-chndr2]